MTRSLRDQIADRCNHFTGVQNDVCKAGVRYSDVTDRSARPFRLPCLKSDLFKTGMPLPPCRSCEWPTNEQVERELAESRAAVERVTSRLNAGLCPQGGGPGTPRRMSGRCAYAPCGHRIGQVG